MSKCFGQVVEVVSRVKEVIVMLTIMTLWLK